VGDFNFVQGISNVFDGINAVAEKYPEFQTALTQRKLADIRELLESLGLNTITQLNGNISNGSFK